MRHGQHVYAVVTIDVDAGLGEDPKLVLVKALAEAMAGMATGNLGPGTTDSVRWSISVQKGELL